MRHKVRDFLLCSDFGAERPNPSTIIEKDFGIDMTMIQPGGSRTEFRYSSVQVAELMPIYDETPAHSFARMLDPKSGLAPATRHA